MSSVLFIHCIRGNLDKEDVISRVDSWLSNIHERFLESRVRQAALFALEEFVMNAYYDAHEGRRHVARNFLNASLDQREVITVKLTYDSAKGDVTVSVEDVHGSFPKDKATAYCSFLAGEINLDEKIKLGSAEKGAGIGLFLTLSRAQEVRFDVESGVRTVASATFNARELGKNLRTKNFKLKFSSVSGQTEVIQASGDCRSKKIG